MSYIHFVLAALSTPQAEQLLLHIYCTTDLTKIKAALACIGICPVDMKVVNGEIKVIGYSHGATGLWNGDNETLSNKPVMILGHDFFQ